MTRVLSAACIILNMLLRAYVSDKFLCSDAFHMTVLVDVLMFYALITVVVFYVNILLSWYTRVDQ